MCRWLLRRFDFFCKAFDFDPARTTIEIANEFVTRELFTTVLRFVYAGEVPGAEDFDSSNGLFQLFRVADYFQVRVEAFWSVFCGAKLLTVAGGCAQGAVCGAFPQGSPFCQCH